MSDYPMDYDEFIERVFELLLQEYGEGREEKLQEFIEYVKVYEKDYLKILYADSCYREDRWGDAFSDEGLIHQPIRLLLMIYAD